MEAIGNSDKDVVAEASEEGDEIGEMEEVGEEEEGVAIVEEEIIAEIMVTGNAIENQREIEIGETAERTEILGITEKEEAETGKRLTIGVVEEEIMIEEIIETTEIAETIETIEMIETEKGHMIATTETEKDHMKETEEEIDLIMKIMKGEKGRIISQMMLAEINPQQISTPIWELKIGVMTKLLTLRMRKPALMFTKT